jgi:threonine/homoserine/homoserine lactone efflux protein
MIAWTTLSICNNSRCIRPRITAHYGVMTISIWLTVVSICLLGAMSPGPSLAVVLKQTVSGGRKMGLISAITHGLGIGLYAMASISGIAVLITATPALFTALKWLGALYLIWIGIKGLQAKAGSGDSLADPPTTGSAARDGFLIVFLNPKVAVFFIALFSQFIGSETTWLEKLVFAATAMFIDMAWYMIVAWLFSNPRWLQRLQHNVVWIERTFGVILIAIAIRLLAGEFAG